MPRKRRSTHTKRKRRVSTKRRKTPSKRRLAGYTKVGKKYAMVFKRGKKTSIGRSRYTSKKSLMSSAKKYV